MEESFRVLFEIIGEYSNRVGRCREFFWSVLNPFVACICSVCSS